MHNKQAYYDQAKELIIINVIKIYLLHNSIWSRDVEVILKTLGIV